jgi:hypothetical protein
MRRKVSQGETLDQRVFRAEAEAHSGELTLKEYIECRDFVEARIRHWIHLLGLRWWEVVTNYYNTEKSADGEDSIVMARCWTEWEYRKIITSWYMPTINRTIGRDQVKLDRLIIHEFMHAMLTSSPA